MKGFSGVVFTVNRRHENASQQFVSITMVLASLSHVYSPLN